MKQSNTSKFAYIAGLIDGEGTIGIYKRSDKNKDYNSKGRGLSLYKLSISIGQKNGAMIDWLYGNFGGTIFKKEQVTTVPGNKKHYDHQMYEWKLNKIDELEYLLKRIIPFLIEKKSQAQIALEFLYKHKQVGKTGRQYGFITKYPEDVIVNWKKFAEKKSKELKEEKKKFVSCAALETKLIESSSEDKL